MKIRYRQLIFLALLGSVGIIAFFCGRTFCLRRYVFVKHNGETFIYPKDIFPTCLETKDYIQLYQRLSQKTEQSEKDSYDFVCQKLCVLRAKAIIRAQNCDYDISQAISQSLENLNNWDKPPQTVHH